MGPDYSRQSASRVHNFNPYKVAMSPAQPTVGPLYDFETILPSPTTWTPVRYQAPV
ncbi:hypothetical protein H9Q72_014218, partial [Fusarium xylarioides]